MTILSTLFDHVTILYRKTIATVQTSHEFFGMGNQLENIQGHLLMIHWVVAEMYHQNSILAGVEQTTNKIPPYWVAWKLGDVPQLNELFKMIKWAIQNYSNANDRYKIVEWFQ